MDGKTLTRFLTPEQLARYQPCFDNTRRLKDLVTKLETASLHALGQTEVPVAHQQDPVETANPGKQPPIIRSKRAKRGRRRVTPAEPHSNGPGYVVRADGRQDTFAPSAESCPGSRTTVPGAFGFRRDVRPLPVRAVGHTGSVSGELSERYRRPGLAGRGGGAGDARTVDAYNLCL